MTTPEVSPWRAEHLAGVARQPGAALPLITARDVAPIVTGLDLWDMWQIADPSGATVILDGREFWFFLAAATSPDPEDRHDVARIRLVSRGADGWRDHDWVFPPDSTPGSREWSGSSVLSGEALTMYFTAAGRVGQPRTFEQRLFECRARFRIVDGEPLITDWTAPVESIVADRDYYQRADQPEPTADGIKGFRDPAVFLDPEDGREWLLFVGSAGWTDARYDGVVGAAVRTGSDASWTLAAPLVSAIDVNSELERPHVHRFDGRYYLFWSTQSRRFAPGIVAPTGLYAMVAERMDGPWRPVNGSGLVAANPPEEPRQAYCWWVTGEREVISFVDYWGLRGRAADADRALRRAQFGGTAAPLFRLTIDGDRIAFVI